MFFLAASRLFSMMIIIIIIVIIIFFFFFFFPILHVSIADLFPSASPQSSQVQPGVCFVPCHAPSSSKLPSHHQQAQDYRANSTNCITRVLHYVCTWFNRAKVNQVVRRFPSPPPHRQISPSAHRPSPSSSVRSPEND
ncbi:hypothetical protein LY76DRAFT_345799 [Colletotrichum caudatum]|nr:hypothetical protein LY76DRAFT_345799 [Colletotrichum caudatum]